MKTQKSKQKSGQEKQTTKEKKTNQKKHTKPNKTNEKRERESEKKSYPIFPNDFSHVVYLFLHQISCAQSIYVINYFF